MCICRVAEREQGTHQCTYTSRYIAKPAQSSLSTFLPAHTRDREPSTNEREPIHIPLCASVSMPYVSASCPPPVCLRCWKEQLGTGRSNRAKERLYVSIQICIHVKIYV